MKVPVSYDHISLATNYAHILYVLAKTSHHALKESRDILVQIFPWLSGYGIKRDGNALRWLAVNGHDPDLNIVFSDILLAEKQIRDWAIEYAGSYEGCPYEDADGSCSWDWGEGVAPPDGKCFPAKRAI